MSGYAEETGNAVPPPHFNAAPTGESVSVTSHRMQSEVNFFMFMKWYNNYFKLMYAIFS